MKSSSWGQRLKYLGQRMTQQKDIGEKDLKTDLHRCLTTPQLTLLGVGNTVGVGIYVLLGVMVKENAGPSTVLCFAAAVFVTLMNALVYAEFATYVPQTGAAYIYIYKVFGEYAAFLCGWVILITFTFSCSVGARAWSGMLDSFFNNSIQVQMNSVFGKIQFGMPFADSLDIVAFAFQIVVVIVISCNVLCSSIINNILGVLSAMILILVFIGGVIYGKAENFINADHGGFLPFGIAGVIKGTSLALYATSGFDIISLSAEEAKNPGKSIPRAIILELLIVGTIYIGAAIGMMFLIPYWLIDLRSPLPSAFEYSKLPWGKFIVTVGPMFSITNLQMLGIYGVSRVMYRMSKDGLFFQCFLKVNKKTGIPFNSVLFVGLVTSVSALLFDLSYIVRITIFLMLINFMIVSSALIKLTISQGLKANEPQTFISETTSEGVEDVIEHEIEIHHDGNSDSVASPSTNEKGFSEPTESEISQANSNHIPSSLERPEHYYQDKEFSENSELTNEPDKSSEESRREATSITNTGHEETEDENVHQINASANDTDQETEAQDVLTESDSGFKVKIASCLSPFFPGVLSINLALAMHWFLCLAIALQINFGWQDIRQWKPVGVLSLSLLLVLLLFLSFLLWSQCHKLNRPGFQTPLMPLVPTLSLLSSSVLMLSSGDFAGLIEVVILLITGTLVYVTMVMYKFGSNHMSLSGDERNSLLASSGDDADDEIESDEI